MRELGSSDKYFYYTASGQGATMDIRLTLKFKTPVDPDVLLLAARDALALFPEYSVRPVLKGNSIFYEENHNPVALLDAARRYDFGTDDMNGYLFCFQLNPSDKTEVVFSVYHGLSDWNGLSRFLKAIFCHYAIRVKALPDDAFSAVIRTQAPGRDEWETVENLNPYDVHGRQDVTPSYSPDISGEVFSLPEEYYDFDSAASRHYTITLSTSEFIKAAKSNHTSFVPFLLCLASQAVREAYDTDKNILMAFPVDLRKVFQTDSIVNFSDSVLLPASVPDHRAPIEEQCRRFREIIDLQRRPENYAGALYSKVQTLKGFEADPEGIIATSQKLTSQTAEIAKSVTMGITYPGIMDMPEGADDLLDNIMMDSPFGVSFLLITTYRDEMSITSVQRYDSDRIVKSIQRKLRLAGLDSKLTDRGLIEHNIMNLERLKRV